MATLLGTYYTYYYNSGTNTPDTTSGGDIYDYRFFFKVYDNGQTVSSNTSSIYVQCWLQCRNESGGGVSPIGVDLGSNFNGGSYTQHKTSSFNFDTSSHLVATDYRTVYHNANGTGSFYIAGRGAQWSYFNGYFYISNKSFTLPTIPRYAVITGFTATPNTPNNIYCEWSTDVTVDQQAYSLDGGTNWTYITSTGTWGSFNIPNLTANTVYNVYMAVKRADSQQWSYSGTLTRTTHKLCSITTTGDFNIDTDIPITIDRQDTTYTCDIVLSAKALVGDAWTSIKTVTGIGASTTMQLSTAEKNAIYALIPSLKTAMVQFVVTTKVGATSYGTTTKTGTATVANSNPTFTTFTYADTNAVTKAITKADTTMIKGYSNAKLTIIAGNKAIALNGSNMTDNGAGYLLGSTGLTPISKAWSTSATVEDTLNGIINADLSVTAIDSRGYQKIVPYTPILIDYAKPIITSATVVRTSGVEAESKITIAGTYTNWGATYTDLTNSIQDGANHGFKYRYREVGGEWSAYVDLSLTTNTAGNFTKTATAIVGDIAGGFTTTKTFEIEVVITDRIDSTTSSIITLNSARPLLWKYKTTLKSILGIGRKPTSTLPHGSIDVLGELWVGGKSLLDLTYPIGSIYETTSTDFDTITKMATHFGGTWEVYGAGKVTVGLDSADTDFDVLGETRGSKTHTLGITEIPVHNHPFTTGSGSYISSGYSARAGYTAGSDYVTKDTGGGLAHNNIQPSIVVYRYRRTA